MILPKALSINQAIYDQINRLLTAEKDIIIRKIGRIKPEKFKEVIDKLFMIISY
jgi:hypothetical protein